MREVHNPQQKTIWWKYDSLEWILQKEQKPYRRMATIVLLSLIQSILRFGQNQQRVIHIEYV